MACGGQPLKHALNGQAFVVDGTEGDSQRADSGAIAEGKAYTPGAVPSSESVSRRRRSAPLIEYMVLLLIQVAVATVIMTAIGAWINAKWSAVYSALH